MDKMLYESRIDVSYKDRIMLGTSSKGSQIRWLEPNGIFVKLNSFGYEGISEELVSCLLDYSDVEHVKYQACKIYEDNHYIGDGCFSNSFLQKGEELFTFAKLLKRYSNKYLSFTYDEVFEAMYDIVKFDIRPYVDQCICVDAIVKNEDRHFNNFAVIYKEGTFKVAPLFDHGLSCLSDTYSFPFNISIEENLKRVYAKPFYTSFHRQVHLVRDKIRIDKEAFLRSISREKYGGAFEVISYGLKEMEGLAWY